MKTVFFCALLALVGCASHTVQMTPNEVQSYMAKTPQVAKWISEGDRTVKTTQPDYCESTFAGPCWKVECIGSANNKNETACWKTPYEAFGISSVSQNPASSPSELLATCRSTQDDAAKRRTACFDYFSYLQKNPSEKPDPSDLNKLLKQFCDMKEVACTYQFAKFGKGDLNTDGLRASSMRKCIYQVSSKTSSDSLDTYELTILKNN